MAVWVYIQRREENTDLGELLGLESVSLVIKRDRLLWFGHVQYKSESD